MLNAVVKNDCSSENCNVRLISLSWQDQLKRDESLLVLEVVLVITVGMGTGKILQRNISVFLNGYCVIYHCQNH